MVSLMDAAYLALGFVVFVVTVAIGSSVLTGFQQSSILTTASCQSSIPASYGWVNCSTAASNASTQGLTGMGNLASQSAVIGTILGAVVIIGLLLGAFMVSQKQ